MWGAVKPRACAGQAVIPMVWDSDGDFGVDFTYSAIPNWAGGKRSHNLRVISLHCCTLWCWGTDGNHTEVSAGGDAQQ